MKFLIIALALIVGPKAMAAKDCTPVLVSPAGDNGIFHFVYPCGRGHAVEHRACNEGEVAYDSVLDPSGNFYQQVPVVCHNGTFAAGSRAMRNRGCTEGEVAYDSVLDPSGNFYQNVTVVCHNGSFVRANR